MHSWGGRMSDRFPLLEGRTVVLVLGQQTWWMWKLDRESLSWVGRNLDHKVHYWNLWVKRGRMFDFSVVQSDFWPVWGIEGSRLLSCPAKKLAVQDVWRHHFFVSTWLNFFFGSPINGIPNGLLCGHERLAHGITFLSRVTASYCARHISLISLFENGLSIIFDNTDCSIIPVYTIPT